MMLAKNKKYAALSVLLILSIFFMAAIFLRFGGRRVVEIKGKKFIAETVLSPEKQGRGLGGRSGICRICAMLFEFEDSARRSFWMKDMEFDLDIIWISGEEIVFIARDVPYDSKKIISPDLAADKVLEINSGLSDEFGFNEGDRVKIYPF